MPGADAERGGHLRDGTNAGYCAHDNLPVSRLLGRAPILTQGPSYLAVMPANAGIQPAASPGLPLRRE